MFEKIQLVPIQIVVALPCAFWAFAGEFAQYLCPGDSLSGIAVLLMLLNRALTRCVNSDFLHSDQIAPNQAHVWQVLENQCTIPL
jgi:hypothetical protein